MPDNLLACDLVLHRGHPGPQLVDHRVLGCVSLLPVERGDGAGGGHLPIIEQVFERVKR